MNFQRLGSGGSARILVIGNSNYPSRDFLRIYASYPETFFGYGNHEKGTGHKGSWLLKDSVKDTSGFLIWKTYVWHHICFAYEKSSSKISFIKVKNLLIYGLNEMTKLYSNYETHSEPKAYGLSILFMTSNHKTTNLDLPNFFHEISSV